MSPPPAPRGWSQTPVSAAPTTPKVAGLQEDERLHPLGTPHHHIYDLGEEEDDEPMAETYMTAAPPSVVRPGSSLRWNDARSPTHTPAPRPGPPSDHDSDRARSPSPLPPPPGHEQDIEDSGSPERVKLAPPAPPALYSSQLGVEAEQGDAPEEEEEEEAAARAQHHEARAHSALSSPEPEEEASAEQDRDSYGGAHPYLSPTPAPEDDGEREEFGVTLPAGGFAARTSDVDHTSLPVVEEHGGGSVESEPEPAEAAGKKAVSPPEMAMSVRERVQALQAGVGGH